MLPTPDYSHFKTEDYENFYEPAEDTFLFLDALEKEINYLNGIQPLFAVEIGSGSGLVINFLAKNLHNKNTYFIATDLNMNACLATFKTSLQNKNDLINPVNCDLVKPLESRLKHSIDILMFNPPYVVTESCELGRNDLRAAWAGGKDGREVMDRLFPLVNDLLSSISSSFSTHSKQSTQLTAINQLLNYSLQLCTHLLSVKYKYMQ